MIEFSLYLFWFFLISIFLTIIFYILSTDIKNQINDFLNKYEILFKTLLPLFVLFITIICFLYNSKSTDTQLGTMNKQLKMMDEQITTMKKLDKKNQERLKKKSLDYLIEELKRNKKLLEDNLQFIKKETYISTPLFSLGQKSYQEYSLYLRKIIDNKKVFSKIIDTYNCIEHFNCEKDHCLNTFNSVFIMNPKIIVLMDQRKRNINISQKLNKIDTISINNLDLIYNIFIKNTEKTLENVNELLGSLQIITNKNNYKYNID